MPEHPISSHMGSRCPICSCQAAHSGHTWSLNSCMRTWPFHAWWHLIYSCMSTHSLHECLMISWAAHWTHVAGFSRAISCSVQVAAASTADGIVHGIPKGAHSSPYHTVSYKQAACKDTRGRDTWRERCQRSHTERNTTDKDTVRQKAHQNWNLRNCRHRENRRLS